MMLDSKMICPRCGAEMNRHAEKIDYMAAPDETDAINTDLDGVLEEIHTCPACGDTEMRPAVKES